MSSSATPTPLRRVEALTLTFLVDNNIEWMTKLPPGFQSELQGHLATAPIDPETGAPVVELDNFCCGAHGLAVLIEVDGHTILFDTGPDGAALARNLAALRVDAGRIERVVLSHWHADHTGGLRALLELHAHARARAGAGTDGQPLVVDAHADRPAARGIARADDGRVLAQLGTGPAPDELERAGARVERFEGPLGHAVAGGAAWVSGEIPREVPFEQGLTGGVRWEGGAWMPDELITDERYMVVDVLGKGLVVFSACSHAGICNVVRDAVQRFRRPIYMIIGGLHLAGPELAPRIAPTVEYLSLRLRPSPTYVLPMHCSGFAAKVALEAEFGEGVVPAGTGIRAVITGSSAADDARLGEPRIV